MRTTEKKEVNQVTTIYFFVAWLVVIVLLATSCEKTNLPGEEPDIICGVVDGHCVALPAPDAPCEAIDVTCDDFGAVTDPYSFVEARIEGHCLSIAVQYGGGCDQGGTEWNLLGCVSDAPSRENTSVSLQLLLKDDDPCEALLTEQLYFDLTTLGTFEPGTTVELDLQDHGTLMYTF